MLYELDCPVARTLDIMVERRFYDEHPPRAEYVLTAKGRELGPVLRALRDWGSRRTTR